MSILALITRAAKAHRPALREQVLAIPPTPAAAAGDMVDDVLSLREAGEWLALASVVGVRRSSRHGAYQGS